MSKIPEPTICLCMMVKNEAAVIRRALASVKPYIDYWVICDTGSDDETPTLIGNEMTGIPGELHHAPWKNFGHNREQTLKLASPHADYLLIMDADMTLQVRTPFKQQLELDWYEIRYDGPLDFSQPMLVSSRHSWRYVGVTHEFIQSDTARTWDFLPAISLVHYGDGGCRSDKFERDVRLLQESLAVDPDNPRSMFYLAQSYKDLQQYKEALYWYEQRIVVEGWEEERWYAMFQRAEMMRLLEQEWTTVLAAYLVAFDTRPSRLEPLLAVARQYRERQLYAQGYYLSAVALQEPSYPTQDRLFIDRPVYEWQLLYEFMICACACGHVSETIEAANRLLLDNSLPADAARYAVQLRTIAFELVHGVHETPATGAHNKLVVIVPFHNPGHFLQDCVNSLLVQDYPHAEVIFIDDASTDSNATFEPPAALGAALLRNDRRMGVAYNMHQAIMHHCQPDDIVVCLDGDDQLACIDTLTTINKQYQRYDCWLLYGQYQDAAGRRGVSAPYASPRDFAGLRQGWRASHLRSFRAGLFQSIADQDPNFQCLKGEDGDWLLSAVDAAMMFPMMEMAGYYRIAFNEKILYRYNHLNPVSHHHTDRPAQRRNFEWVCKSRPFAPVKSYYPSTLSNSALCLAL